MSDLRPCLGAIVLALVSCTPAGYADRGAVESAQKSWCDALAKANGAPGNWEHLAACKAAYPTASAPYLRQMSKCFPERKASYGDKPTDTGHLVAECNDEVTAKMNVDDSAFLEAIDARCERANRCEKVAIPECVGAVKKLESSQRALLYGVYNATALHTIASCLKSSACDADEDSARAACYKQVEGKLLWFPN
ncbi:MAG: hypothetical protein QM820_44685 [Minicystis sp.]